MSVVPHDIPEVGATSLRLRQNPRFDPLKAGFGTEEYFVWSRFDGTTTVKDLILMTGLAVDRAITIVRELRRAGAILMPGESAPPAAAARPTEPPRSVDSSRTVTESIRRSPATPPVPTIPPPVGPARGTSPVGERRISASMAAVSRPPPAPSSTTDQPTVRGVRVAQPLPALDPPTAAERAMHAEAGDLSLDERTRMLAGLRLVAAGDPWALVGVAAGSDRAVIKRAFFERSKLFHPDRFYGRKLGVWQLRINTVFEAISNAHAELVDPRAAARSAERREDSVATAPQSPTEYAAELFDRACLAEVSGETASAVRLFAAAVKLDPVARYLRRAATCALAAGEHQAALDHARKATALEPSDPSTARTLSRILRALDRLDDAEEVLVMALAMRNSNEMLAGDLAADLGLVRAALSRR